MRFENNLSGAGDSPRGVAYSFAAVFITLSFLGVSAGCAPSADSEVVVVDAQAGTPTLGAVASTGYVNEELSPRVLRRFAPLDPAVPPVDAALTDLGRKLYYEPRLSKTGKISCNSCHPLDKYGATQTTVSTGILGRKGARNAPSVYNASGHIAQFWDGRAANVEQQAVIPLENKNEMGLTAVDAVDSIQRIPEYRAEFARVFPADAQPVSAVHIGAAIGAFEHGLVTPARWDRYLRGDKTALTPEEKAGAKLFANLGCIVCHTGPYVGGSMFERLGVRVPWPKSDDHGRRQVTGAATDDMVFKVPSLRNVTQTAPYFHDGSAATLNQAVRMMARHQLGVELDDDEANELQAWLGSLTGDIPTEYIKPPVLPPGA